VAQLTTWARRLVSARVASSSPVRRAARSAPTRSCGHSRRCSSFAAAEARSTWNSRPSSPRASGCDTSGVSQSRHEALTPAERAAVQARSRARLGKVPPRRNDCSALPPGPDPGAMPGMVAPGSDGLALDPVEDHAQPLAVVVLERHEVAVAVDAEVGEPQLLDLAAGLTEEGDRARVQRAEGGIVARDE